MCAENKAMEDITFVMPAFNVERFIEKAVDSIKSQTIEDWRLIMVDDGSTDNTFKIASALSEKDPRITILKMDKPSGSAYQPRKKAILEAKTEWVAPLDADDWIAPDYLEKLIARQRETEADLIYPSMFTVKNGEPVLITPTDKYLLNRIYAGKDCVKFTLDGWRINCNGGLIRKDLYVKAFSENDSSLVYSCADELLTRQLLLITPSVAFSDAAYFYRTNEDSITRKQTLKLFDYLINNKELINFTADNYPSGSEEEKLARRQNFHGVFDALSLLNRYSFSKEDTKKVYSLIADSHKLDKIGIISPYVSKKLLAVGVLPLPIIRYLIGFRDKLGKKE